MKLKLTASLIVLVSLVFLWRYPIIAQEKQSKASSEIMQKKLKHAQKLLENLALADFVKMTDNAEELMQLSKTAEWMAMKTPKYEMFNNEFQRATGDLIAKAKAKNIDGATLAYLDVTMSCVRCHSYVREVRGG